MSFAHGHTTHDDGKRYSMLVCRACGWWGVWADDAPRGIRRDMRRKIVRLARRHAPWPYYADGPWSERFHKLMLCCDV